MKSLVLKVLLIIFGLLIIWGLFLNLYALPKIITTYTSTTESVITNSETSFVNIIQQFNESSKSFFTKYVDNTGKTQEKDLQDIPFDLYGGDEDRIKEAVKQKTILNQKRAKQNFSIIQDIWTKRALQDIDLRIKKLRQENLKQVLVEVGRLHRGTLFTSLVGFILLVVIFFLWIYYVIISPIRRIVAATEKIGAGELCTETDVTGNDEISHLASSFNMMTASLRKTTVSKQYADNVINSMGDILVVVGSDGRIQNVNDSLIKLTIWQKVSSLDNP